MCNRLRLILLGVFCSGILLTGIGAGIAIVEYTSLEYTGVHVINGEITREDYEFKIELGEDEKFRVMNYCGIVELVYDKTVPVDTVRCSVQYNQDIQKIWVGIDDGGNVNADDSAGCVWLYISGSYVGNEFDLLMRNKDSVLADLKQGKIGTYIMEDPVKEIVVKVNPEMKDVVDLERRW